MQVVVVGFNLPGSTFPRPDGSLMSNVHVGVQVGRDPTWLVRADAATARWEFDIEPIERDGDMDFRGKAVQGKRGDRFLYLTWGNVTNDGHGDGFEMFRRAKLMLRGIEPLVLQSALAAGRVQAKIDLTGDGGGPRCAGVKPPVIEWSVPTA